MRVQRVLAPDSMAESWTLLGGTICGRSVPAESFLAYLTAVERSPNTVKAYAYDEGLVELPRRFTIPSHASGR
jgi:integrase/recombinase XerD